MKSLLISSIIASAPVAAIPQGPPDGGAFLPTLTDGCVVGQDCPFDVTAPEDLVIELCSGPDDANDCFFQVYSGPPGPVSWIVPDPQDYGYTCADQFFFRSITVSGGYNWSARWPITGCGVVTPPTDCTCPDDPACQPTVPDPCTDPNGYCNGNGTSPVPYDPSCPGGYDVNGACTDPITIVDPVPVPCDDVSPVPSDPYCPGGYDVNGVCVDTAPVDPGYGCTDPNGNCGGVDPTCPSGTYDDYGNCIDPIVDPVTPCDDVSPVPSDPYCPGGYDANGACVDPGYGVYDSTCPDGIYDDTGACVSPVGPIAPVDPGYGCNGSCDWDDDTSDDDDVSGVFPGVDFGAVCGVAPTDPTLVADYVHNCMFKLVATVFVDICATINISGGVGVGTGGNPFTY